jgi:AP-1 complex subunit gamma-1
MSARLRELIRSVRNCKTAAEERAVIAKECAAIRTALKEKHPYRARNVAKLMYIHMLGYPTHFGQMECINLIVSQKYPEKRIGYLALMILLDETQEVLPLIEHTLKKDLDDKNQFVQALALTALANIASEDICRDLSAEVEKLLFHSPYIRKKAALCAVRIIKKCPDLIENYVDKLDQLLNEKNHGVLLTTTTLITEIVKTDKKYRVHFRKLIPTLLKLLKTLLMSAYALEHDVSGVADPFLQVKILRLLRALGKGSTKASEMMSDVLAQVATNTESTKNPGNAILYECVRTILEINAESGLRTLAVNQLGKFLVSRENNLRFVSLHALTKVVSTDSQAVFRHINTIIECLKDHDVSIRKRALELIYVLVNASNVQLLVNELMNYLQHATDDLKESITTKICTLVEKFAPSNEWKVNTLLQLITLVMCTFGSNSKLFRLDSMCERK